MDRGRIAERPEAKAGEHQLEWNGKDRAGAVTGAGLYLVRAEAVVRTTGRTGVEMEALTAVAVALLTVYDMAKAIDRDMVIENIVLLAKTGGKSGPWSRLVGTPVAP